jgi:hypothetical protein
MNTFRLVQQIRVAQHELVDEEVGMLSDAVVKLKGMAKQIGDEAEETGKIQELVAQQLEMAQVAMKSGVKKMQRMHRDLTSSCGHMIVMALYAVCMVMGLVFLARVKAFLTWLF